MKKYFFLSWILILLVFNQPGNAITENNLYGTITRNYVLGPNDVISIYVYDFSEFDQEDIKIPPDGNIVLSNIGIVNVSGMSLIKLHEVIYNKLLFYLNNPRITIKLEKTRPIIVYVTGAVQKPGSYELNVDTSGNNTDKNRESNTFIERRTPLLSNVLAAAGGINYNADLEKIKIRNSLDNSEISVNLLQLLEGDTSQDIYLMSNDTVIVPELDTSYSVSDKKYKKYFNAVFSPDKVPVKVLGYVNEPGLIYLKASDALNLNAAISSAGGYYGDTPYPPRKIYLSRVDKNGKLTTTAVNPTKNDCMLRPNDIIYVPEKIRPTVGKMFDYMTRIVRPFGAFSQAYNDWALIFEPHRYQIIGK